MSRCEDLAKSACLDQYLTPTRIAQIAKDIDTKNQAISWFDLELIMAHVLRSMKQEAPDER